MIRSMWFCGVLALCLALLANAASDRSSSKPNTRSGPSKIIDIQAINITSNLADWRTDLVVMFYAPWCKYCKQLIPSWEAIAGIVAENKDLAVTKLNCEGEKENVQLCKTLGVDRYPTIVFFGYGDFNQAPRGNSFGKQIYPQMVQYVADLYPEAIYDWIVFLSSLSSAKRRWDDFVGIFTGKSRMSRKLESLERRVREAEKKAIMFGTELERYKANELFDSLEDNGDIFPLLHELEPDQQNLPLRVCVGDMSAEFCQYNKDDEFCRILDLCIEQNMESKVCRPKKCPFEDTRGCVVASTCMKPEVISQYKKSLKLDS